MPEVPHPTEGFSVLVPEGWSARTSVGLAAMVVVAPDEDLGFRPNLVVTREEPPQHDLSTWRNDVVTGLADELIGARVIDHQWVELPNSTALRVLAHHLADEMPVALEQWIFIGGQDHWCISASVAALAYDRRADTMREAAESMRFGSPAVSS